MYEVGRYARVMLINGVSSLMARSSQLSHGLDRERYSRSTPTF